MTFVTRRSTPWDADLQHTRLLTGDEDGVGDRVDGDRVGLANSGKDGSDLWQVGGNGQLHQAVVGCATSPRGRPDERPPRRRGGWRAPSHCRSDAAGVESRTLGRGYPRYQPHRADCQMRRRGRGPSPPAPRPLDGESERRSARAVGNVHLPPRRRVRPPLSRPAESLQGGWRAPGPDGLPTSCSSPRCRRRPGRRQRDVVGVDTDSDQCACVA